jgi:hypothetical protein
MTRDEYIESRKPTVRPLFFSMSFLVLVAFLMWLLT